MLDDGGGEDVCDDDGGSDLTKTIVAILYRCVSGDATHDGGSDSGDDGSCYYLGCTDPLADNYNANATVDDGSCTYTAIDVSVLSECFGTISNIVYMGDTNQISSYTGFNFLGLDSGIVLSTGHISGLTGAPGVITNPNTDNLKK